MARSKSEAARDSGQLSHVVLLERHLDRGEPVSRDEGRRGSQAWRR